MIQISASLISNNTLGADSEDVDDLDNDQLTDRFLTLIGLI